MNAPGGARAAICDGIDGEVALLGDFVQLKTWTSGAGLDETHDAVVGKSRRKLRVDGLQEEIDVGLAVVEQADDALCAVVALDNSMRPDAREQVRGRKEDLVRGWAHDAFILAIVHSELGES